MTKLHVLYKHGPIFVFDFWGATKHGKTRGEIANVGRERKQIKEKPVTQNTLASLHAIEPTRPRGKRRVDGGGRRRSSDKRY